MPSATDRKKEINQHLSNVSVHAVDCLYDDFQKVSSLNSPFVPSDLDTAVAKRKITREIVVNFLNNAVEVSNANLIRNANHLLSGMEVEPNIEWVGKDKERLEVLKCNMNY